MKTIMLQTSFNNDFVHHWTATATALLLCWTIISLLALDGQVKAFVVTTVHKVSRRTTTHPTPSALKMGLFDGMKDAFSAPALERSTLDGERETPIDRWMGWNTATTTTTSTNNTGENNNNNSNNNNSKQKLRVSTTMDDFIDAMDARNYIRVTLPKPMGIVFEENDADVGGGVFVQSLKVGGMAASSNQIAVGDQLVAVNHEKVSGLTFDDALNKILDAPTDSNTPLLLFRGAAKQLYGPTGASQAWLDEFIASTSKEGEQEEQQEQEQVQS